MRGARTKHVTAVQHVRNLRGGSLPALIQASDGFLYVVKFGNNPQGENIAFNESMGCELLKQLGLPVPQWAVVEITDEFLDRNRQCRLQTEEGARRPSTGPCFGLQFMGISEAPLLEILPGSSFSRIRNRMDLWMVWMLDILCEHTDNRQALFLEDEDGSLDAYFIDNGHLFGGPRGMETPCAVASRYLDPRIYGPLTGKDCTQLVKALKSLNREDLIHAAENLPDKWKTPSSMRRFERFLHRATDETLLHDLKSYILAFTENEGKTFEQTPGFNAFQPSSAVLRAPVQSAGYASEWAAPGRRLACAKA